MPSSINHSSPKSPSRKGPQNVVPSRWRSAPGRIGGRQEIDAGYRARGLSDGTRTIRRTSPAAAAAIRAGHIAPATPDIRPRNGFAAAGEREKVEELSRAVTLTVLELVKDREKLLPAYLMANMMSPALWDWREVRRAHAPDGSLLSVKRRLSDLQRQFHRYNFTNFPDMPGGDPWGLINYAEEERRLGKSFVQQIRQQWDGTLRYLLQKNPDSQFGKIVGEPYYREGRFPRLRNETFEVMNAYGRISPDGRPSGKCGALTLLWAAALMVWGRFPTDQVVVIGNRAHLFAFLDVERGHLFNNTKWFSGTRMQNGSELSEYVKAVATGTDTTFFHVPAFGMWDCDRRESSIPRQRLPELSRKVDDFLSIPLKCADLRDVDFLDSRRAIPDPSQCESAEQYQDRIQDLAGRHPMSVYDFAQYAFRTIRVSRPQAYARAALRDYHAREASRSIRGLEGAIRVVKGVTGTESVFCSRERIALPDETLKFQTGNDRDKALLLYALLHHSSRVGSDVAVGFSDEASYVRYDRKWIDVNTFSTSPIEPEGLWSVFDDELSRTSPG